jgi:hypothetical protein
MNASAALLSGLFVAGTVKTCERSLGQKVTGCSAPSRGLSP